MKTTYQFCLTTIGILMLGSLPYLLFDEMESMRSVLKLMESGVLKSASFLGHDIGFHPENYVTHIVGTISGLFHFTEINYYYNADFLPLFPAFFYKFLYSMTIFLCALFAGLLIAVLFTFLILMMPDWLKKPVNFVLFVIESIPDLFIILILQTTIIWLYIRTDIMLFDIFSSHEDPAYILPILCLAILPAIFLIKHLVQLFEEESDKLYVEFARGKGLRKSWILLVHILRNTLIILFYQFKTIFWFALSNLLMLEIIFNMKGFMNFMWSFAPTTPFILTIGLLMIFIPFYFVLGFGKLLLRKGGLVHDSGENI
ncbi:ABC transporter permease subunit [Virgibacillus ihumii]|uniref:ABC transporter permease subunit n=1 Tax=Virgibacillus ihumii TaxID=2686091 RepID=UPI00157DFB7F|nr:ABC transporter permease subunit [Virgibacillus ihumii]